MSKIIDITSYLEPSSWTSAIYKARVVLHVWVEDSFRHFEIFEKSLFLPQFQLHEKEGSHEFDYVDEWLGETDYSEIDELYENNKERFIECLFDYRIYGERSFNGEVHEWDEYDEIENLRVADIKDENYLEWIEEGCFDERGRCYGLLRKSRVMMEEELSAPGYTPTEELKEFIEELKRFGC